MNLDVLVPGTSSKRDSDAPFLRLSILFKIFIAVNISLLKFRAIFKNWLGCLVKVLSLGPSM